MPPLRHLATCLLLLAVLIAAPFSAHAAQSYDNCAGFIDTLPAIIGTEGVWCLRHDLNTAITSGAAITVNTNNVTVDCNDFKVGGLAGGIGTQTVGIYALSRLNATVRHCNVRGFYKGVALENAFGHGHLVEDNRFDGNTWIGVRVEGPGSVVRRNQITDTGGNIDDIHRIDAVGISTTNTVDVLDNTISGVLPSGNNGNGNAYGIYASGNHDGSISNNRVRGVIGGTGHAWGIYNVGVGSGRISLDRNHVVGDGSSNSTGILCAVVGQGFAIHNIVNGFGDPNHDCGGNDNVFAP